MEVYKDNNSRDSIHLSKFNNKIYNEKGIEASNKEQTFSFMDSLRGGGESTKNRGGDNSIQMKKSINTNQNQIQPGEAVNGKNHQFQNNYYYNFNNNFALNSLEGVLQENKLNGKQQEKLNLNSKQVQTDDNQQNINSSDESQLKRNI